MGFSSAPRRIGLARTLSKLGYCSRSRAGELIRAGRVKVNGALRRNPESPVNVEADRISVDDENVSASKRIYLILNKPRGVVTSALDEKGRKTVYAYLDAGLPFVSPVGRLDKASEGLLLLTNDSEWGARIVDPETHLDKTYHVQIGALADEALLQRLAAGVKVDGELLRARRVRLLRHGERNCWLEVVLDEGKNRQIRRMLDVLGIEVLRLVRVAIGPLVLGDLCKGAVRKLTHQEKYALDKSLSQSVPQRSTAHASK
ncbi:MAG TPA: pseudouridine synthase [Terriglobales bacterium]|nr:pseudouridine synthase [Terriglobales bacterium]